MGNKSKIIKLDKNGLAAVGNGLVIMAKCLLEGEEHSVFEKQMREENKEMGVEGREEEDVEFVLSQTVSCVLTKFFEYAEGEERKREA